MSDKPSSDARAVAEKCAAICDEAAADTEQRKNEERGYWTEESEAVFKAQRALAADIRDYAATLPAVQNDTAKPAGDGGSKDYEKLYHELLYAVANKHPGETRHQTALRYLQQAESQSSGPAKQGE